MGQSNASKQAIEGTEKEFLDIFKRLCCSRSSWQVWSDVITAIACSISNASDRTPERFERREKEYAECINRLGGVEKPAQLFEIIVKVLEKNPDQDFLGALYMKMELGNHWKGQFFTPYNISRMMAEINIANAQKEINKKGWIAICDPCVGGGAMLLAAANTMRRQKIYYHDHVLFVGQDVDRVVGLMAYIQMSLLGCPGYIVIGDSLTNPITGSLLNPAEQEGQEFWYTTFYNTQASWVGRRFLYLLGLKETKTSKAVEKEHFYIFFDFKDEEDNDGI